MQLEDFEIPELDPTQILIQTRKSLISPGTEYAFYMELPNTPGKYPVYPGYSNIGEVVAVGEEVTQFSVGDV
ncbi:MAG: alcohol dehydrogenase catalytic domain-containing protein, partial [Chloroflexota bacterium]